MKFIDATILLLVAFPLFISSAFGWHHGGGEETDTLDIMTRQLKGKGSSMGHASNKRKKAEKAKKGSKSSSIHQTTTWGCDPFNDPCFEQLRLDGQCGSVTPYDPTWIPEGYCSTNMSDCLDCDPCSAFHYTSCSECTANEGCLWCPGDALCYSTPWIAYPTMLDNLAHGPTSSCSKEDDWLTMGSCETKSAKGGSNVFTDPLYDSDAWAYKLLNVEEVWKQGITGSGVHIRINDEGVDANHPEFAGKFDVEASCSVYLPADATEFHGTACASIATARGDNDMCAVGIAPDATLSACNILGAEGLAESEGYSFITHALQSQDVSSNSWAGTPCKYIPELFGGRRLKEECPFLPGPEASPCLECDFTARRLNKNCTDAILNYCSNTYNYDADSACIEYLDLFTTCGFYGISQELQAELALAVKQGRGGKGLVFVFASSNENDVGSYSSFDGKQSSRFIISVGAVGKDGKHASYSTAGPSVLVSAPGGDIYFRSNWITASAFGGCKDETMGTSFATPATAGVIALILQANPNLGWRDVQGILATTSQMSDPKEESWVVNGAGLHHSYKYGFGIVDAAAAVRAAPNWENYSAERMLFGKSGNVNVTINDLGDIVTSSVTIDGDMTVESVVVYLELSHSSSGHLDIRLTSPQGTESILSPGMRPANTLFEVWMFRSVRTWGESSAGQWTLSIADTEPGDVSECVDIPIDEEIACWMIPNCTAGNDSENAMLAQACCQCGGGMNASSVPDMLVSWTLIVYGHDLHGNLEPTVSPAPTFPIGTVRPAVSPDVSAAPTLLPSTLTPSEMSQTVSPAPTFPPFSLPPIAGSETMSPPPTVLPLDPSTEPQQEEANNTSNFATGAASDVNTAGMVATSSSSSSLNNAAMSVTTPVAEASGEQAPSSAATFVFSFSLLFVLLLIPTLMV